MHPPRPTRGNWNFFKIETRNFDHPTTSSYDSVSKSIVVGASTSSITSADARCNWANSDCFSRPNRHSCASTTFSRRRTFAAQAGSRATSDGHGMVASIAGAFRLIGPRLPRPRIAIATGTTSPDAESIVAILYRIVPIQIATRYKIQLAISKPPPHHRPHALLPHQRPPDASTNRSSKKRPH